MNLVVLGSGAWGTAMALHLGRCGHAVTLVARRLEHAMALSSARVNETYLPGHPLPDDLQLGHELKPVLMEADFVFLACPARGVPETSIALQKALPSAKALRAVVTLSKGLVPETGQRPTEFLAAQLSGLAVGCLSGPSHAAEVASGQPTALTLAGEGDWIKALQEAISRESLRVYRSPDVAGVEWAGVLKNVYAIGAGISDGLGLGDNARAAYLTRALTEMARLGTILGGQKETFFGLSGLGDLVATCQGSWSRNHQLGEAVARGAEAAVWIAEKGLAVEGYGTVALLAELSKKRGLDTPILSQVARVLYEGHPAAQALGELLQRDPKEERA